MRSLFLAGLLALTASAADLDSDRQSRAFSLFNVVQFPNNVCRSNIDGNLRGTCFSKAECESKGGRAGGNCAQGFGVCCVFITENCNDDINYNNTYIQNEAYPARSTKAESCTWNVNKLSEDICFIRIDFQDSELANVLTAPNGNCATDKLEFTGGNGAPTNTICGDNSGAHMYLECGSGNGDRQVQIKQTTTGETTMRLFRYRVSQIECNKAWTPRSGCTQWFTRLQGRLRTFNQKGGQILDNQDVTYCVRQNEGYCRLSYMTSNNGGASSVLNPDQNNGDNLKSANACTEDYFIIPQGRNAELPPGNTDGAQCVYDGNNAGVDTRDRYCGNRLSCRSSDTENRRIVSMANGVQAFTARFISDATTPTLSGHEGFNLMFRQEPC